MRLSAAVVSVVAALLLAAAAVAVPASRPERTCPGYGTYVRVARERLARGDRAGSIAAMRRARAALDACLRGAPSGPGVLVGVDGEPARALADHRSLRRRPRAETAA
jgi:hypothetical protein